MPQYLPSQEQLISGSQALPMGRQRAVPYTVQCLLVLGMVICDHCWYLVVYQWPEKQTLNFGVH